MPTENALTPRQRDDLRILSSLMIPPSAEYRVPGADDAAIQADLLATLGRDAAGVREALDLLAQLAEGPLNELDDAERQRVAARLRASGSAAVAVLTRVVLQCYYRDARVVRSLGLEARAPFPKGHVLEGGDWSLLDPVRARPSRWRRADNS